MMPKISYEDLSAIRRTVVDVIEVVNEVAYDLNTTRLKGVAFTLGLIEGKLEKIASGV